jgi:hypothetical protein
MRTKSPGSDELPLGKGRNGWGKEWVAIFLKRPRD